MFSKEMYLYIQTPPVHNSNKIPHLVEHCSHNFDNLSFKLFFARCNIKSETFFWYTRYNIYNYDVSSFIESIESPFSVKLVKKELKSLNQELKEKIFTSKLRNITFKELNLCVNTKFSFGDVFNYHLKYYSSEYYAFCDENFNILSSWITLIKPWDWHFCILSDFLKKICWESNYIIIFNYKHRKDQILASFLELLVDSWLEYNERYVLWHYFYPCSSMIEGHWYISFAVPNLSYDIPFDFFENVKNFYISQLVDWKFSENRVINLMYISQLPSMIDIESFVKNLDYRILSEFKIFSCKSL